MRNEYSTTLADRSPGPSFAAIAALLTCEFALTTISCWPHQEPTWEWPHPLDIICTSVLFSQYALLGAWAVFGQTRLSPRVLVFLAGTVILWMFGITAEGGWGSRTIPVVMTFFVGWFLAVHLGALLCMRAMGVQLAGHVAQPPQSNIDSQYSIRSLIILTGIVAVFVAIGRYLELHGGLYDEYFGFLQWWYSHVSRGSPDRYIFFLIAGPCLAAVGVWSVSLALGRRFGLLRAAAVIFLSGALGLIPPMYFARPWRTHVYWPVITGLESLLVIVPLAIVRRYGYRFISTHEHAQRNGEPTSQPTAANARAD